MQLLIMSDVGLSCRIDYDIMIHGVPASVLYWILAVGANWRKSAGYRLQNPLHLLLPCQRVQFQSIEVS